MEDAQLAYCTNFSPDRATTFNIFDCFEAHHHLFRLLHNSIRTCLSAKQVVMGGWWVVQKCRPVRSIGGLLFSFGIRFVSK